MKTHEDQRMNRRNFGKLTMAALGGAVASTALSGCQKKSAGMTNGTSAVVLTEPHVCRGLNTCKGKGAGGGNACAGHGACATAKAHACGGHNECKGQGGCGETTGHNACKGQGKCAVPLSDKAWEKARNQYEQAMNAAGKPFGSPPAKG